MPHQQKQPFVVFRQFTLGVFVVLMMMGSADVVLAQHGGGRCLSRARPGTPRCRIGRWNG
ncbi:MAG: hypothetical protein ACE10K_10525 [Rhodothermales bacterium]